MPAECLLDQRLGFYFELLATILLPLGLMALAALLVWGTRLGVRQTRDQGSA